MAPAASACCVVAESLCRRFSSPEGQTIKALDDLSVAIPQGQLVALVGPDGAGKSTLLRMMAGLLSPDQGSLRVLGLDVRTQSALIQARIGYMPQRFGLYEDLTVQENLDLYADLHGVSAAARHERFDYLLRMMDLERFTTRLAGKLSGGMKQKLGLACTLVRSPRLLLLDEPGVGVDPLSRRDLWVIIETLVSDESLSVIVSTTYMDEAERCADVVMLQQGRLMTSGRPDVLSARAQALTALAIPSAGLSARQLQARLFDARELIVDAVPHGGAVRFIRQPGADPGALAQLLEGIEWRARPATLEDAFQLLLHEHAAGDKAEVPLPAFMPREDGMAASSAAPVIAVRNLTRRFGDFTAVNNTSFTVCRSEIFGLLGPNGAGKTTTFRMLCGLLPASSGTLEVTGLDLRTARAKARGRIGYVAQKFALYGNLSVRENLRFFGAAYGLRGRRLRQRIEASLERFELDPGRSSGQLPAGYKQRLAMATALLHEPEVLFLDEPTSGIDPQTRRMFWRSISALADQGVTVIVTTHFMEEAEYCDRIAIQDAGSMLAIGTPGEVRAMAGVSAHDDMNRAFIAIVEQHRARVGQEGQVA